MSCVTALSYAQSPYDAYAGFSIPAADAIVRYRIARVVTISALGREERRYAGHVSASLAMDDLFRSTGVHLRALTMPSFMDNMLWQAPSIKNDGVISATLPGDLKAPTVATRDIAAVATRLLLDHTWTGQDSLGVLGPEDLSFNEWPRSSPTSSAGQSGSRKAAARRTSSDS